MPLVPSSPTDRVILGLMTFGPDESAGARITDVGEFRRCLTRFQERGYGEVDTARVYTARKQEAFTREAGWKDLGLTLATKFQYPGKDGDHAGDKIVESLETSLKELGTDCVDICYLHAADRSTPFATTLEAVDKLHKAGKFVQLGLSNFTAAEVAEVVMICKYNGWVRPTVYQAMYNAITRGIEPELVPTCRRYGIDIVVYNPIAGGLFSGKIKSKDFVAEEGRFSAKNPSMAAYRSRYMRDSTFRALQTIEKALEKHEGLTIIETALRWTVHHSALRIKNGGNDGIIIGVSSYDQLDSNLTNLEKGPLPEDVIAALDEAWMICKAEAPNYWHGELAYKYDTREALFGAGANRSLINELFCVDVADQNVSVSPDLNEIDDSDEDDLANMSSIHPSDAQSGRPLLEKDDERGRSRRLDDGSDDDALNKPRSSSALPTAAAASSSASTRRPAFTRSSTVRSRSPASAAAEQASGQARRKYVLATAFLVVCLTSFVVQTELGRYVQHELGWNKAYCMLYLTHGSWALLWPAQLLFLRLQRRRLAWPVFWRRHVSELRATALSVKYQTLTVAAQGGNGSPWGYVLRTTAGVTSCLTVAGLTWYVAVSMTSPTDLTAIYNCSAFFAYAFSVPLLGEKLRLDKSLAVLVAIIGVLVVAYGDSSSSDTVGSDPGSGSRLLGNLIIGVGSVLYGLYEVLYKRFACPPEGTSASRGVVFANTFGSCIGVFTLLVLWFPLPILHILGWEIFELPTGMTAFYLFVSVVMNATFAGSFLVLISLTSPVLSSVAALLTIFLVAVADWLLTAQPLSAAALAGGAMIVAAFGVLAWSTWREMAEEEARKAGYRDANVEWDSDADDVVDGDGDGDEERDGYGR
ncbi:NADP-dependent oxidoreductase domain-containing protein [Nemania sp. FL0916]|nr:NADP-dependent oxidoreductase domain-containing protein [Nemania sp. FL0916]